MKRLSVFAFLIIVLCSCSYNEKHVYNVYMTNGDTLVVESEFFKTDSGSVLFYDYSFQRYPVALLPKDSIKYIIAK